MVNDLILLQNQFIDELFQQGKSANTLKNYRTDLTCFNQYLNLIEKKANLHAIESSHITEYGHFLMNKYKSDNSKRRRIQTLRTFFDFLIHQGHYVENPVRSIAPSPKFLDIPRPTPFAHIKTLWLHLLKEDSTTEELSKLIAKRNQIIFLLIFGAGLKVSDLAKIQRNAIIVPKDKSITPRIIISPSKREPYTIPLPKVLKHIYKNYNELLFSSLQNNKLNFSELLFNANPFQILNGGLSPRGLEIIFEELRKKLLISLTPKSLRQACIFKWLHQKHPDSLIKEWMGVAPSYTLCPYKNHIEQHPYSDDFLLETYLEHNKV